MRCIYCGYETDEDLICHNCGHDLSVYKRIQVASALCYNEGLRKARVRDLSGAIDELTKALKYNKYNIQARNLLGLVYFEVGEPVNAMAEWVISKNLSPDDNIADAYLSALQSEPSMINKMDSATKKYNQAVALINRGDYDLAKIQLKRLVSENRSMIRARSLLALLYLRNSEPKAARKELVAAAKIDVGNPTINTYFQEVKEGLKAETNPRRQRRANGDITEESVVTDSSRFSYIMDYSKVSIVNIIIGSILGVLVSVFLIFPAIKQQNNNDTMNAIITANEEVRSNENDLTAMQKTIDALTEKLATYEGKADIKDSYENLVSTLEAVRAGDMDSAANYYQGVTRELLNDHGAAAYDRLSPSVGAHVQAKTNIAAKEAMDNGDFANAVALYTTVISVDETYDEGRSLSNLAFCYMSLGDVDNAIANYTKVAELFPNRRIGREAAAKVSELGGAIE